MTAPILDCRGLPQSRAWAWGHGELGPPHPPLQGGGRCRIRPWNTEYILSESRVLYTVLYNTVLVPYVTLGVSGEEEKARFWPWAKIYIYFVQ